jgi:AcrR family transcriptional regulator
MARPQEPLIERDRAVRVALEMIDELGLPAFSVEQLARRLGVRGPSLYHHFAHRSELLARVAELILHEVPDPWDPDGEFAAQTWDERLLRATVELRRAIRRHHNAAAVLLEHFPRQLVLGNYENAVIVMEESGVPLRFHVELVEGLEKLALGFGLYRPDTDGERGNAFPDFAGDEFPALRRALAASPYDDESLFAAACAAFIEGVKLQIAAEGG